MTLGRLRTFVAVARAGSIRGAAEALSVSEPSVSAAVATLERELGLELLEPSGRGIRLTAAGEELASRAAEALGLLEQGAEAARQAANAGAGRLRLAAVTTAGEHVVPTLLRAFRTAHPDIVPALEVGNRAFVIDRIATRAVDLGIGGKPPEGREITGIRFAGNNLVVVARADHPLARRRTIRPRELAGETWLLREPGSGTRAAAEELLASAGVAPQAALTLGSNGAVVQAAAAGLGITLVSTDAVAAEIRAGTLARLAVAGTPLRRGWWALYHERGMLPRAARSFLTFLRSPAGRKTQRADARPA